MHQYKSSFSSLCESYRNKGESPLWVTWFCDVSRDITLHSMSFLPSEGSDVRSTGGVGNVRVVIRDSTDSSISAMLVGIMAVGFDVSSAIAKGTLGDLGTPFCQVSCACTPVTVSVLVIWTILPPVGEVGDSCIEYGTGDVGRNGGIMEDTWFESSVCIGATQRVEGVILFPSRIPIEPLKLGQIFGEVCHLLMGVTEALDFSSQRSIPFSVEGKVDHGREGLIRVEGVGLLSCEYSVRVGVRSCVKQSGVVLRWLCSRS